MDDLEYFSPTAPTDFKLRGGRLIAAGIVLLLAALPLGFLVVMAFGEVLRFRRTGQWTEWLIAFILLGLTIAATTTGLGLIIRLRWSRPIGLCGSTVWLLAGSAGVAMMAMDEILRRYRFGGRYAWAYLDNLIVPYAIHVAVWVGAPSLLRWLLCPDDVRRTLEYFDPSIRWTDGVHIPQLNLFGTFIFSAVVTTVFVLNGATESWTREYAPSHEVLAIVAPMTLAAAIMTILGWRRFTLAAALVAFLAASWAGWMSATPFGYRGSNETPVLCYLIAVNGIIALQALRQWRSA